VRILAPFVRDASGNDHQIALPRDGGTLRPKARNIDVNAPIDIISMRSRPNQTHRQIELLRIQLTAESIVVSTTPSGREIAESQIFDDTVAVLDSI